MVPSTQAPTFRIHVLGPFLLECDGAAVETGRWQRRPAALMRLLAASPGGQRLRDEVIDLFWPESEPEAGAANLRYVLHLLRRYLRGLPSPVVSERGQVKLNPACVWEVDAVRFEELGRVAGNDPLLLEEMIGLYRGEPLIEDRYEDWAAPFRERVQRTWRQACLRLSHLEAQRGRLQEAVRWHERLLDEDPCDEEALQGLLRLLIARGSRTEALRRYGAFERRVQAELAAMPSDETQEIVETLRDAIGPTCEDTLLAPPTVPNDVPITYPLHSSGTCIGRRRELQEIEAALSATGEGETSPRLLLLSADAGMGKTWLLGAAADLAKKMGGLVLAGGCYEHEGQLPYGPIHDALLDYVRVQSPQALLVQLDGLLADLALILPELRGRLQQPAEGQPAAGEERRLQLFVSVAQMLERVSAERPLVLLLDDLQWADDTTLQLVHFLARQHSLNRVLLLGAYRGDEGPGAERLGHLVLEADRGGGRVRLIRLDPLDEPSLGDLVAERLGGPCAGSLVQALHRRSGGNPFFALEMARLLMQQGRLERASEGWRTTAETDIELPEAVRETVARRLKHGGDDVRAVLDHAAVLGRDLSYAALEATWEGDEVALFAALDRATATHILQETEQGYSFRHPLLWEVVYGQIPRHRRARLHAKTGDALESLYARRSADHAVELFHHFLEAGPSRREQAHHYALLAGEQAELAMAHTEAAHFYRTALELLPAASIDDSAAINSRLALLQKLSGVLRTAAAYGEALKVQNSAIELAQRSGNVAAEAAAVAAAGELYCSLGQVDDGIARVRGMVETTSALPAGARLSLQLALVNLYAVSSPHRVEALAASREAVEMAQGMEDNVALVRAQSLRGWVLMDAGRSDEVLRTLPEIIPLAEQSGPLDLVQVLRVLALACWLEGELGQSLQLFERAHDIVQETGGPLVTAILTSLRAHTRFYLGQWRQAGEDLERAVTWVEDLGTPHVSAYPLAFLGELCLARGEWKGARRYLERAIALGQESGNPEVVPFAHALLGELKLQLGRPEDALPHLEPFATDEGYGGSFMVLPILAEVLLALDRRSEADEIVQLALTVGRQRTPFILPDALRVEGKLLALQGRAVRASQSFEEALAQARGMQYPYVEARTLYDMVTAGSRAGEMEREGERTVDSLGTALSIFRELGARPFVERIEARGVRCRPGSTV